MSRREWKRLDAVERIGGGRLTSREAAEVLGLSTRQVQHIHLLDCLALKIALDHSMVD